MFTICKYQGEKINKKSTLELVRGAQEVVIKFKLQRTKCGSAVRKEASP